MKLFTVCLWVFTCISAFASTHNPPYFSGAKGIVIGSGFEVTGQFELNAGKLLECQGSESGDTAGYGCDVEGLSAVMTLPTGGQRLFRLGNKINVFHLNEVSHGPGWYYEFEGTCEVPSQTLKTTSKVHLSLWRYDATPQRLKGSLTLTDYSISQGVEAEIQ
jgi:hypothetical protein